MKKTVEQLTKEFIEIMTKNGFEATGEKDYAGNDIYSRKWERTSEVVWHGLVHSSYEIRAKISYGYPRLQQPQAGTERHERDHPLRRIRILSP